ncbi:MAG TPA: LptF/LptG family permease [Bacillota bacterium]|nr:LptF/LptG family permease [Bacillota bacterium]
MRITTRYILKELILPFIFGISAFSGILMAMSFLKILQLSETYGLSTPTLIRFLLYQVPENVAYGIPMAMILATLLGLSGLSSHSETTAMRAGGISIFRLAVPVLIVGLLVSIGHFYLNESVIPKAIEGYNREKTAATGTNRNMDLEHYFYPEYKGQNFTRLVYAEHFNPATGKMTNVSVMEFENKKLVRTIIANTLVWQDKGWYFQHGEILTYRENRVYPLKFSTGYVPSGIKASPEDMVIANKKSSEMSFWELSRYIHFGAISQKEKRKLLVDLYVKSSMPFASFFLALMGAPIGLRPQRRSASVGFGLSISFLLLYYFLFVVGSYLGGSILPPILGAWLQNILTGAFGIYQFAKFKK